MKYLKHALLLVAASVLFMFQTACNTDFPKTTEVIGKWQLVDYNGKSIDQNFVWEFKEDKTFNIHSELDPIREDLYDSEPWDGAGDFEGKWRLSGPTLIEYRQKYQQYATVRISEVSESELVFDLFGEYGTKFYNKKFTFKKVQ